MPQYSDSPVGFPGRTCGCLLLLLLLCSSHDMLSELVALLDKSRTVQSYCFVRALKPRAFLPHCSYSIWGILGFNVPYFVEKQSQSTVKYSLDILVCNVQFDVVRIFIVLITVHIAAVFYVPLDASANN